MAVIDGLAWVRCQDIPEVIVAGCDSTHCRIGKQEERAILGSRVATEGVCCAWDICAAQLPHALPSRGASGVDWVKVGTDRRIYAARTWAGVGGIGDMALANRIGVALDARQVCLERDPTIVLGPVELGTGK